MAAMALPQRIDLSALFQDAWRIARAGAAAAACSARLCLGNGLRMAWARARAALQRRAAAESLRERIALNDFHMGETRAEIDAGWGVFRREPSELYAQLDHLHADGVALRDELAELEAPAMVPQQAQQQQANGGGAPEPVEPEPDLSTVEGLAAVLVGRRVVMPLMGWDVPYEVTGVKRWESDDGTLVRDYLDLNVTGVKPSKGPVKLYVERKGSGRGNCIETRAGRAFWAHGVDCNSGSKRSNADAIVREILAPIAL